MTREEEIRHNYELLKSTGHSVELEETLDADGKLVDIRARHSISCRQCVKDRNQRVFW